MLLCFPATGARPEAPRRPRRPRRRPPVGPVRTPKTNHRSRIRSRLATGPRPHRGGHDLPLDEQQAERLVEGSPAEPSQLDEAFRAGRSQQISKYCVSLYVAKFWNVKRFVNVQTFRRQFFLRYCHFVVFVILSDWVAFRYTIHEG